MVGECKNILHYRKFYLILLKTLYTILYNAGSIRRIIAPDVRQKLEERIIEENIGAARIINLERCTLIFGM
jgi:hypothetical protein